jgi:hypothetical protein
MVGTAVGCVARAAVGYVGNELMNTETGQAAIAAAGGAVDAAIGGVEAAGEAVAARVHGDRCGSAPPDGCAS